MIDNPATPSPEVIAMRENWAIIEPLLGGTKAMRAAGRQLLKQFPAEDNKTYGLRLAQSTLFPALQETINNMVSRVFAEPLRISEDTPEDIKPLTEDVDLSGCSLNNWGEAFFTEALSYGLCFAYAEFPKSKGLRTREDEQRAGVRPYAVMVHPLQYLGCKSKNGKLTQFRYLETVEEDAGLFDVKRVKQVRVLEPGRWSTYRKSEEKKGDWVLYDEGETSLDFIPLVTCYTGRTGFMTAKPPLMELAHLNVKHWQSQSDQDNLLHVARVPLLFTFTDDEQFELAISAGSATQMPKDGDAKYVEHTGAAIEAGRVSLQDLMSEMRMAGAKLLQKDAAKVMTAEQSDNQDKQELSPIARMAVNLQASLIQMLAYMAKFKGQENGGSVEVRGNFDSVVLDNVAIPALQQMAAARQISYETLFEEMQRRGAISGEHDWESEKERLLNQPVFEDEQDSQI